MERFHVNKQTGRVGKCRAVNRCPFGDMVRDHYPTREKAMEKYEELMSQSLITKPVRKSQMKHMSANDLAHEMFMSVKETKLDSEELSDVLELSSILHASQKRMHRGSYKNTPYIEHPLRASLRLMKNGVSDASILKAALLHDTVEDSSKIFVKYFGDGKNIGEVEAREVLLNYIGKEYGEETAKLVKSVTNDYVDGKTAREQTPEEKREIYLKHLKAEVTDNPKVMLIKISDFTDNAGSLHNQITNDSIPKVVKQALKYYPCVEVFREELAKDNPYITQEGKDFFLNHLNITEKRLREIIDRYNDGE